MNKLTTSQKFQIALGVLGVLVASTGQLTDLFGPQVTKYVVSVAGLGVAMLSTVGAIVTGQGSQIQDVQDMARNNPNSDAGKAVVQTVVDFAKNPTSPVQGIITTATPEGKALAASIPGPIVTAGSDAAVDIAKS
jgi:hypothetical protein